MSLIVWQHCQGSEDVLGNAQEAVKHTKVGRYWVSSPSFPAESRGPCYFNLVMQAPTLDELGSYDLISLFRN